MKKTSKRDKINLVFSAFLIIAFVVCGYFFSSLAQTLASPWNTVVSLLIFVLFGLVLFYATRVGEGKQKIRFSLSSLILVILPSLYIILAAVMPDFPLHEPILENTTIVTLACVALGYGLPYTFVSGFELSAEQENTEEISAEDNEETVESDGFADNESSDDITGYDEPEEYETVSDTEQAPDQNVPAVEGELSAPAEDIPVTEDYQETQEN